VLVIILLQAVSPYDAGADSLLKAAKPPKGPTPLTKAPKDGLLGGYIYKWDNSLQRWHQPIRIKHSKHYGDLVIAPYETFWIELAKKKGGNGVNIVFKDPEVLNGIPVSERVENAPPFTLFMGSAPPDGPFKQYFYQFTLPDADTNENDLFPKMDAWSGSILIESNHKPNVWGVSKYIYDEDEYYYPDELFEGNEPFDDTISRRMYPGQGYVVFHSYDPFGFVPPSSGDYKPLKPVGDIKLKLPYNVGSKYTLHHIANPYWVDIDLRDSIIETPINGSYPIGKSAELVSIDYIDTWHMQLSLEADGQFSMDEFNRAGVAIDYSGDTRVIKALDMFSPHDSVRLTLHNSSGEDQTRFAYDFRPAGENTYRWELEMTTQLETVDAVLNVANIAEVPESYQIFLEDKETGSIYDITQDSSIEVSLRSGTVSRYILTAMDMDTQTAVEFDEQPTAFGICGVSPNPFNPSTTITYALGSEQHVTMDVFNMNGQWITNLINAPMSAGHHSVLWNASKYAAGVYIVRMQSNEKKDMQKITLVK